MTRRYKIIRECVRKYKRCVITTNCYGDSLRFMDELFAEAVRDFPSLERNNVQIVLYGGRVRKRIYGLEFTAPGPIPESYQGVEEFEPLMN